jgi:hypothetical protein
MTGEPLSEAAPKPYQLAQAANKAKLRQQIRYRCTNCGKIDGTLMKSPDGTVDGYRHRECRVPVRGK